MGPAVFLCNVYVSYFEIRTLALASLSIVNYKTLNKKILIEALNIN